ncbi:hypothetical protein Tco_0260583 [Tanacetum coccineum]
MINDRRIHLENLVKEIRSYTPTWIEVVYQGNSSSNGGCDKVKACSVVDEGLPCGTNEMSIENGKGQVVLEHQSRVPPSNTYSNAKDGADLRLSRNATTSPIKSTPVMDLDPSSSYMSLLFETKHNHPLLPLQSLMQVEKHDFISSILEPPKLKKEHEVVNVFSTNTDAANHALTDVDQVSTQGTKP